MQYTQQSCQEVARPSPRVTQRPLRMALLMNIQLRKSGSFEQWVLALCREARLRGHAADVFARHPVLPFIADELKQMGVGLERLEDVAHSFVRGRQRLSRYDVLQLNFFGVRSRIGLMACGAWPARVLYVDHTSGLSESPRGLVAGARWELSRRLDRLSATRLGGIAAVSRYVEERDRQRFALGPERLRTIYNGVDLERFHPSARREGGARLVLLTVAHLIPHKGVETLLRAVALMHEREVELLVVGDGPEAPRLQRLAEELGLGARVQFLGLRNDVEELLARADVFVHPALWQEAFGLTIAEAMACGRPVLASYVGGIPELIEHERSGLLFPPGAAEVLARELDRLAAEPGLRERLGRQARARVEALFELRTCVRQHLDWCEELAAGSARSGH